MTSFWQKQVDMVTELMQGCLDLERSLIWNCSDNLIDSKNLSSATAVKNFKNYTKVSAHSLVSPKRLAGGHGDWDERAKESVWILSAPDQKGIER
jgi:hypothetical protein